MLTIFSFACCHSLYLNDLTCSLGWSRGHFVTGLYPLEGPVTFLTLFFFLSNANAARHLFNIASLADRCGLCFLRVWLKGEPVVGYLLALESNTLSQDRAPVSSNQLQSVGYTKKSELSKRRKGFGVKASSLFLCPLPSCKVSSQEQEN